MTGYEQRAEQIKNDEVIVSNHARVRMFERNVSTDELLTVIAHGEIIETYPDDEPCPSALILGFINHTVYLLCRNHLIEEKSDLVDRKS